MFEVQSLGDMNRAIRNAHMNRSTNATDMNERSSRSHLLVTVHVDTVDAVTGDVTSGKLHLVDLAGSERLHKSRAEGQARKEAQAINKSLSALGQVVAARAAKKAHTPFRDSTLTFLLQDALAGDSKMILFVCISAMADNAEETFCSLEFASRAATVTQGRVEKHVSRSKSSSSVVTPSSPGE